MDRCSKDEKELSEGSMVDVDNSLETSQAKEQLFYVLCWSEGEFNGRIVIGVLTEVLWKKNGERNIKLKKG